MMPARIRAIASTVGAIPTMVADAGRDAMAVGGRRAIAVARARSTPYAIHRALRRMAGASEIRVSGIYGQIVGSIDDRAILERYALSRTWCPVENNFFVEFFEQRRGGTYLDIGANIGLTTIPVARNWSVICLAFEPEPSNFGHLRTNVRTNCHNRNVELFQLALFDNSGSLEFQLSPSNKGDHRVRVDCRDGAFNEASWPVIRVDAERLDDVLAGRTIDPPLAAKVVAQGAEAHIIAGGCAALTRAEIMVVEFFPYALDRMRADVGFLLRFLSENFGFAAIMPGGQQTPPAWNPVKEIVHEMQRLMRPSGATAFDYFHVFLRK